MSSAPTLHSILPDDVAGKRLDQALTQSFPEYSRSRLQQWLKAGNITVDGRPAQAKQRVHGGEKIVLCPVRSPDERLGPESIELDIVHVDRHIIVLNKQAGLVVHPGAGNPNGTLVNALVHYDPELATVPRAGVVHRIDKDTTGLLVVARTLESHTALVRLLKRHEIQRRYVAIVQGAMTGGGIVDAPISRHQTLRTRMRVVTEGKPARTHFRLRERFRHHTALDVSLETGRTHQIRVHMAHHGYPLVGDGVYSRLRIPGGAHPALAQTLREFPRQALHAAHLELQHPGTGQMLSFEAPIPLDMCRLLEILTEHDK